MKKFIEARIILDKAEDSDVAVARLAALGFDGFVEEEDHLLAYIEMTPGTDKMIHYLNDTGFSIDGLKIIEDENWNASWEASFKPVLVDNRLLIRAPFHEKMPGVEYDLVIEPKMSFGTAHHETTFLMLQIILDLGVKGKRVLDMGSGTAILAILAKLKGAADVAAIDNDEWAYSNAKDNCLLNKVDIRVELGDAGSLKGRSFDIIFANINRNILLEDIPYYRASLNPGGALIMSGFYKDDLELIREGCMDAGLAFQAYKEKNNWIAATFTRT